MTLSLVDKWLHLNAALMFFYLHLDLSILNSNFADGFRWIFLYKDCIDNTASIGSWAEICDYYYTRLEIFHQFFQCKQVQTTKQA